MKNHILELSSYKKIVTRTGITVTGSNSRKYFCSPQLYFIGYRISDEGGKSVIATALKPIFNYL